MRPLAVEILACPHCSGPLGMSPPDSKELVAGALRCEREHLAFPVVEGVPHLVRLDRTAEVESFAEAYSQVWRREGWGRSDPTYLLGLPYRDATRRQRAKWRVKARSMDALFTALDARASPRVVDMGCGMGWLSHHLARRGHDVYAVDIVRDDTIGLGAAAVYARHGPYFERVWGEFERPPFRDGSVDAVVCNASLHYVPLEPTLAAIARVLRPGGGLFVLNSPVHRSVASATRAQEDFRTHLRGLGAPLDVAAAYHHFSTERLIQVLEDRVGPTSEVPFDPGRGFRLARALKGRALRMELASFPILKARKPA